MPWPAAGFYPRHLVRHVALTAPEGAAAKWQLGSHSTIELSIAALAQEAPLPGKTKHEKDKKPEKSKTRDRESPDFTLELVQEQDGSLSPVRVGAGG